MYGTSHTLSHTHKRILQKKPEPKPLNNCYIVCMLYVICMKRDCCTRMNGATERIMTTAMLHNIRKYISTELNEGSKRKEKKNYLLHATKRTLNFALIQWKSSPRESGGIKLKLYYCHLIYAVPMRRNFFDFVLFSFVSYTEEHEAAAVNRSRNLLDL